MDNISLTKEEALSILKNLSIIEGVIWSSTLDIVELMDMPVDLLTKKILDDNTQQGGRDDLC